MTLSSSGEPREAWLREAVARYEAPLMAYALRLLDGHLDGAQDAVQETFLRLCRTPPDRLEGRLAPWLFAVCRTRVIDMRRNAHCSPPMPAAPLADPSPGPEQVAQLSDEAARLQRMVEALPERQRELLYLRLHAALSYREIAAVTGLSVTNVGYHLHAAIRSLRSQMSASTKKQMPSHSQNTYPISGTE